MHNSTYPKVAVQWLNQALRFYQSLCLVDSEVLSNEIALLPNLEELHIRYNRELLNLPSNIGTAKKIKKVSLYSLGSFFDFEDALQILSSLDLQYLELGQNWRLKRISSSVFEFENLKYLGLNIYETDSIPKEIGKLINLEEIELGPTNFKYLPEEFGNLKSLKKNRFVRP